MSNHPAPEPLTDEQIVAKIEAVFAERDWPTSPRQAARAGWEACRRASQEAHPAPNALIHTGHDFNPECPACLREDQIYDEGYKDAELTLARPAPAGSDYVSAFMDGLSWMEANRESRPGEWREAAQDCARSRAAPVAQPSPQPSGDELTFIEENRRAFEAWQRVRAARSLPPSGGDK